MPISTPEAAVKRAKEFVENQRKKDDNILKIIMLDKATKTERGFEVPIKVVQKSGFEYKTSVHVGVTGHILGGKIKDRDQVNILAPPLQN